MCLKWVDKVLTWRTLEEGDEQPYRPSRQTTQSMNINIFWFSCEWTIS